MKPPRKAEVILHVRATDYVGVILSVDQDRHAPSVIDHIGVIVLPRTEDDTSHKTGSINIGHLEGAVTGWRRLVSVVLSVETKGCQQSIILILVPVDHRADTPV